MIIQGQGRLDVNSWDQAPKDIVLLIVCYLSMKVCVVKIGKIIRVMLNLLLPSPLHVIEVSGESSKI
jgi:hypothetical protein